MGIEVQGCSEAAPPTLTSVLIKMQSLNQQGFVSALTLSLVLCSMFFTIAGCLQCSDFLNLILIEDFWSGR